jgi:hypothetical protein
MPCVKYIISQNHLNLFIFSPCITFSKQKLESRWSRCSFLLPMINISANNQRYKNYGNFKIKNKVNFITE